MEEEQTKELKETAIELASFLTDNYSQGDSIFFNTDDGAIEGFVVEQNYYEELTELIEPEEGEEVGIYVTGYKMQTILRSKNNTIMVQLFCTREGKGICIDGAVVINNQYSTSRSDIETTAASISIKVGNQTCVLQKGIGITNVRNGQYSWSLPQ